MLYMTRITDRFILLVRNELTRYKDTKMATFYAMKSLPDNRLFNSIRTGPVEHTLFALKKNSTAHTISSTMIETHAYIAEPASPWREDSDTLSPSSGSFWDALFLDCPLPGSTTNNQPWSFDAKASGPSDVAIEWKALAVPGLFVSSPGSSTGSKSSRLTVQPNNRDIQRTRSPVHRRLVVSDPQPELVTRHSKSLLNSSRPSSDPQVLTKTAAHTERKSRRPKLEVVSKLALRMTTRTVEGAAPRHPRLVISP